MLHIGRDRMMILQQQAHTFRPSPSNHTTTVESNGLAKSMTLDVGLDHMELEPRTFSATNRAYKPQRCVLQVKGRAPASSLPLHLTTFVGVRWRAAIVRSNNHYWPRGIRDLAQDDRKGRGERG